MMFTAFWLVAIVLVVLGAAGWWSYNQWFVPYPENIRQVVQPSTPSMHQSPQPVIVAPKADETIVGRKSHIRIEPTRTFNLLIQLPDELVSISPRIQDEIRKTDAHSISSTITFVENKGCIEYYSNKREFMGRECSGDKVGFGVDYKSLWYVKGLYANNIQIQFIFCPKRQETLWEAFSPHGAPRSADAPCGFDD